jgi:phosphohistidine phosphatase
MRGMRRLFLLRHAKSDWDDRSLPDHDRPLAPRGERAADAMARHLTDAAARPDLVWCSSALRARQTLGRVLPALGAPLDIRVDPDLYTFDPHQLLERIRSAPEAASTLFVVGHNPAMEGLTAHLLASGQELQDSDKPFPAGALAEIELDVATWRKVGEHSGRLVSFTTPRSLEDGGAARSHRD